MSLFSSFNLKQVCEAEYKAIISIKSKYLSGQLKEYDEENKMGNILRWMFGLIEQIDLDASISHSLESLQTVRKF